MEKKKRKKYIRAFTPIRKPAEIRGVKTSICPPRYLKEAAMKRAAELGVSFSVYISALIQLDLESEKAD